VKISEEHVRDLVREALRRRMLTEDEDEDLDLEVEEGPDENLKAEIEKLFTAANVVVGDTSSAEDRTARDVAIKGLAQMARDYNEGKYSGADKKYFDERFWPKMKSLRSKGPGETAPGKKGHARNLNTVPKKGTPPTPVVAGEEHKWLANKGKAKAFQGVLVAALGLKTDSASDRRIMQRALGCRSSRDVRCPVGAIGSKARALWRLVTGKPAGKNTDLPAGFSSALASVTSANLQPGQQAKIKAKFKSRPSTPSSKASPPTPSTPPSAPTAPPSSSVPADSVVELAGMKWKMRKSGDWTTVIRDPDAYTYDLIQLRVKPDGTLVSKGRSEGQTLEVDVWSDDPENESGLSGDYLDSYIKIVDMHRDASENIYRTLEAAYDPQQSDLTS